MNSWLSGDFLLSFSVFEDEFLFSLWFFMDVRNEVFGSEFK